MILRTVLNRQDVRNMAMLFDFERGVPLAELQRRYGVSEMVIRRIVEREQWTGSERHVFDGSEPREDC